VSISVSAKERPLISADTIKGSPSIELSNSSQASLNRISSSGP
jgi:hypothetical protein